MSSMGISNGGTPSSHPVVMNDHEQKNWNRKGDLEIRHDRTLNIFGDLPYSWFFPQSHETSKMCIIPLKNPIEKSHKIP